MLIQQNLIYIVSKLKRVSLENQTTPFCSAGHTACW